MGVCDISADYKGSIEFTRRFTSIEEPFIIYDATKGCEGTFKDKISDASNGENFILFHCVDHLPAEMPLEASNYFGSQLYPFLPKILNSNFFSSF
jgi:alpha-aminoadipic semialdehyde synthase